MCKNAAHEKRITKSSAWFMCTVTASYVLWKNEKMGAMKISSILNDINQDEYAWNVGDVDLENIRQKMKDKYGIEFGFSEESVRTRTNSDRFQTFLNKKQLENDNQIYEIADRFTLLLLNNLIDYGYGEKRLTRVNTDMFKLISETSANHTIYKLYNELRDYCGLELEKPKDYMEGVS